jgi:hypothetical protein
MPIHRKSLKPFSASSNPAAPSLLGLWENELGSTLDITNFNGTVFSGTYTSSVSSGQNPVSGPVEGTLAGDAVGFTVNWLPTYSSVTSWNGLLLTDGSSLALYTLWQLASTPESELNYWESILAGADLFVQVTL